jgi:hypothetical protein
MINQRYLAEYQQPAKHSIFCSLQSARQDSFPGRLLHAARQALHWLLQSVKQLKAMAFAGRLRSDAAITRVKSTQNRIVTFTYLDMLYISFFAKMLFGV